MGDTSWFDGEPEPPRRGGRRIVLAVLAGVPWLLVAGLLVLPGRVGDDATPATNDVGGPETDGAASEDAVASDPAPDGLGGEGGSTEDEELELAELRGLWRLAPGVEEAASLAVVVARAALTGLDPRLTVEEVPAADDGAYAEHLVVEAVEHTEQDAVVVTVLALVLEDEDDLGVAVRRLAVPVALGASGPRPAGAPWELPGPELAPQLPDQLASVDDADLALAAGEALERAGLDELELVDLHTADGWPVIAEVRAPDAEATRHLWLRRHLDGFAVAGTTLADRDTAAPDTEARP